MPRNDDPNDHKGLIREAYRIDGITLPECRSIFLDWALSLPEGRDQRQALSDLHASYAKDEVDHPMTQVLTEGLQSAQAPKRRGGWRSRNR
ncbi:hypothetical protein [Ruegeria faecimaris]|uniref:Uncharacterized protein n=1 Tax=Ruegeria faecimaris TaxID=686389 RepID=A0A521ARU9_9RHOB|nr:hypothetical protein [Ruegeria faecimaris]SMO37554.1 hypothetical protein SAMN06265380_101291 [Ruegeria faecimaris]